MLPSDLKMTPLAHLAGLHLRGAIPWLRSLQPTT